MSAFSLIMVHSRSFEENFCLDRNSLRKLLKCSVHYKPFLIPVLSTDPYLGNLELFFYFLMLKVYKRLA